MCHRTIDLFPLFESSGIPGAGDKHDNPVEKRPFGRGNIIYDWENTECHRLRDVSGFELFQKSVQHLLDSAVHITTPFVSIRYVKFHPRFLSLVFLP